MKERESRSLLGDRRGGAAALFAEIESLDALEQLGVELPESEDYDTVGGFITATLGRIPTAGEVLRIDGAQITVIAAEATRVGRIRIESTKNMPEPTPEEVTSTGAEPESLRSGNSQR
jgi:Mg2+/Co2+ transporter CorC